MTLVVALSLATYAHAESFNEPKLVPFDAFVSQLGTVPRATSPEAGKILGYLQKRYRGLHVKHSYMFHRHTFDCVPINEQPSVRELGLKEIAKAPPPPEKLNDQPTVPAEGPKPQCAEGEIPLPRITPEDIAPFGTLEKFLKKEPAINGHSYAHEYQFVKNFGGKSILSLYSPPVDTTRGEVFSLSQHWYVGGTGAALQTAEVGIQAYPQKYRTPQSVLFIYWTADDYRTTGCYNLDCAAFVQISNKWHLGTAFQNYSMVGSPQFEVVLGFYFHDGNWWLQVGQDWVGYYPGTIFRGGQLSRFAQEIDFGGETVGLAGLWPPMGSGQFAAAGYPRAAYHRKIIYRTKLDHRLNPSLTVDQRWPQCQTASAPQWGGVESKTLFFFGGPGGRNC